MGREGVDEPLLGRDGAVLGWRLGWDDGARAGGFDGLDGGGEERVVEGLGCAEPPERVEGTVGRAEGALDLPLGAGVGRVLGRVEGADVPRPDGRWVVPELGAVEGDGRTIRGSGAPPRVVEGAGSRVDDGGVRTGSRPLGVACVVGLRCRVGRGAS